jgi:cytochrome c oxidase subunit 3
LLLSSYTISGAVNAFKEDSFIRLKIALSGTLFLGLLFTISQYAGWKEMIDHGFFIQSNVGVAYLYVITGMHFLHLTLGLLYLGSLNLTVYTKSKNIASSLLYLTDSYQLTRLELLAIYWHFVDFLWVMLFFMFLFSL